MQTLFLIPCPIADDALPTLPADTLRIARELDVFIVEKAKTARHFIKSTSPAKPIQEMIFTEIGERQDDFAEAERTFRQAIEQGKSVGLLSEAGCPGVADPGANLVLLAHRMGVRVQPLVGPSSLLLALMASGMNGQSFTFHGYLSPKRPELAQDLRRLEQLSEKNRRQTQFFIETPYRSQMVFEVACASLQATTLLGVAQDLTGVGEFVRTLPIAEWRKIVGFELGKMPAVFLIQK